MNLSILLGAITWPTMWNQRDMELVDRNSWLSIKKKQQKGVERTKKSTKDKSTDLMLQGLNTLNIKKSQIAEGIVKRAVDAMDIEEVLKGEYGKVTTNILSLASTCH